MSWTSGVAGTREGGEGGRFKPTFGGFSAATVKGTADVFQLPQLTSYYLQIFCKIRVQPKLQRINIHCLRLSVSLHIQSTWLPIKCFRRSPCLLSTNMTDIT